jgi:hypothetical protein
MAFKIGGFAAEYHEKKQQEQPQPVQQVVAPKKSVVKVYFIGSGKKLSYYNDQFDLHNGDMVYVEGSMEGQRGRVIEVSYNFKIKLSDYKRVIAVIDTNVHGQFFMAGSHFVAFDPAALPAAKARMWFLPPAKEDEEIVCGNDDSSFKLEDLSGMQITHAVAERGHDYYMENRVRYLCIDGTKGYAIVEGGESYEVEFDYHDGEISNLLCSCPCTFNCKHEFAAMLQLKETLDMIAKHYAEQYEQSGYFAAVNKATLFAFAVDSKETGTFTL